MNRDRLSATGLSRYFGSGIGVPPETEPGHFNVVMKPFADKYGMSVAEFTKKYASREIIDPELEEYFAHDRSVRESGHDTSYRLEGRSAHLVTVDLNSLLYKIEKDIAQIIDAEFNGVLKMPDGKNELAKKWYERAVARQTLINKYLWNEKDGLFYDYDFVKKEQTGFESATTFYPLWAGLASKEQAEKLVNLSLSLFEEAGGISGGTEKSRGPVSADRPPRQWDFPNGWAPHQMIIWQGLINYGYEEEAKRLAYKWLYMITKNAVDYNGTIPEKYDVVSRTHMVFAEYGNVGTDFSYITKEGFGWMNASYQLGLTLIPAELKDKLNKLIPPEWIFGF